MSSIVFILRNSDSVLTADFDLEPGVYDKQLPKPHTRGPPTPPLLATLSPL